MLASTFVALLATFSVTLAKNCDNKTYGSCSDGITHSYDADDGQICDPLDCGGGRAPVKTNEPCCPAYTGSASCTTKTSFLPCFAALASSTAPASSSSAPASSTSQVGLVGPPVRITSAPSSSGQYSGGAAITSAAAAGGNGGSAQSSGSHITSKPTSSTRVGSSTTGTRSTTGLAALNGTASTSAPAVPTTGGASGVQVGGFMALAGAALVALL